MGNLCKITSCENKVQFLSQEQLEQPHGMLNVQILQVKEFDDFLFWDGTFIGSPVKVAGINCLTTETQISISPPPENMSLYFFWKELVFDIFLSTSEDTTDREKVPCQEEYIAFTNATSYCISHCK